MIVIVLSVYIYIYKIHRVEAGEQNAWGSSGLERAAICLCLCIHGLFMIVSYTYTWCM